MLRHTIRSLGGVSWRAGQRCLSASAPLRVPEVEDSASTSTGDVQQLPPGLVKVNRVTQGEIPAHPGTSLKWHKVNELHEWDWFQDPLHDPLAKESSLTSAAELPQLALKLQRIQERKEPYDAAWLDHHHEVARTFRLARARLWTPSQVALFEDDIRYAMLLRKQTLERQHKEASKRLAVLLLKPESKEVLQEERKVKATIRHTAEKVAAFDWAGRGRAIDDLYKEHWIKLTDKQRSDEMLRVRYECARRVGWRKGYTSGYPEGAPQDEAEYTERRQLLEALGSKKRSEVTAAMRRLADREEAAAWQAWISMDKATRREEEKAAWELRDRSMIYTDDSAHILDEPLPRWYLQPQKVGSMVFLPNTIVRLVRNTSTRHGSYDAFKATFRVPLSMHKHGLRSYLLAIYGLRTTWCRSLIYRAPVIRDERRQMRIGSTARTFKKVEVGLLEPFLFPEITPRFKQEEMRVGQMSAIIANTYLKATGARRWRGKMPIRPVKAKSKLMLEDVFVDKEGLEDADVRSVRPSRADSLKKEPKATLPTVSLRDQQIPTKKKSRILRLIHKQTLKQERQVAARVLQLKQEERERAEA